MATFLRHSTSYAKPITTHQDDETYVNILSATMLQMLRVSGAPNDRFLSNAVRRCFRLSGVLLKLSRLILGCTKKILSVRIF